MRVEEDVCMWMLTDRCSAQRGGVDTQDRTTECQRGRPITGGCSVIDRLPDTCVSLDNPDVTNSAHLLL